MPTGGVRLSHRVGMTASLWAVVCLQGFQCFFFLVMGLGWGGVLYTANVVQGVVLLLVSVGLAAKRRLLVLLVPVVSFVISLGLQQADAQLTARACSPAARAAVAELGLSYVVDDGDPFTYVLDFPSTCSALFSSADSAAVVVQNYRQAGLKAGWELTGAQTSSRAVISNDLWTVEVAPDRDEEGLIELLVHARRD